ncbi:MAG: YigZ family protein, partial [Bacteroidia bacterium]
MQVDKYQGITAQVSSEYRSSGSKFYGYLFPINSAEDFEQRIKQYKEEYADATHVCSACVIGVDRAYQRCSDDGEPSSSS